jgi:hypothetical protein
VNEKRVAFKTHEISKKGYQKFYFENMKKPGRKKPKRKGIIKKDRLYGLDPSGSG